MSEFAGQVEHRLITIRTLRHVETGLLLAVSDDMKGLYVHARTEDDLWERIPIAIRAILEADGVGAPGLDTVRCSPSRRTGEDSDVRQSADNL